jgi:hypothetical protein
MLTELATRMDPGVSVLPDRAILAAIGLGYVGLPLDRFDATGTLPGAVGV